MFNQPCTNLEQFVNSTKYFNELIRKLLLDNNKVSMIDEFMQKYESQFINSNEFVKKIADRNLLIRNLNDLHLHMKDLVPNFTE